MSSETMGYSARFELAKYDRIPSFGSPMLTDTYDNASIFAGLDRKYGLRGARSL